MEEEVEVEEVEAMLDARYAIGCGSLMVGFVFLRILFIMPAPVFGLVRFVLVIVVIVA